MASIIVATNFDKVEERCNEEKINILIRLVTYLKKYAAVRTGKLRNSIYCTDEDIVVGVDYASFTEYRTHWFSNALRSFKL